jgi:predicted DNA-binding transcriptional regulator AlpA
MLTATDKPMTLTQVAAHLGVCRQSIMNWVRSGHFPKPFKLGSRTLRWHASDIEFALLSRLTEKQK